MAMLFNLHNFFYIYNTHIGIYINQEDDEILGNLYGFNASSVSGCKVKGGTSTYNDTIDATWNSQRLDFATTNVVYFSNNK